MGWTTHLRRLPDGPTDRVIDAPSATPIEASGPSRTSLTAFEAPGRRDTAPARSVRFGSSDSAPARWLMAKAVAPREPRHHGAVPRLMSSRPAGVRSELRRAVDHLGFEVIPFKKTEAAVLEHVPRSVPLTVTASPAKGQDATVDLAVALVRHGYAVSPHLSARQVRDRAHLARIVGRCREAGITGVFVVGGDPTEEPTEFRHAHDLLVALHELDHGFTDIGIGGHPEGHPDVPDEVLFEALADKAPLATHITTQIVFDSAVILRWARELKRRGIDLPVHIGVPGAVHRQKLLRVSGGLGIGASAKFLKKQQSMFWRFFVPGGYSPKTIIDGLAPHLGKPDNGIVGFHVFTFNDLAPTEAWRQRTLQRLG